MPSFLSCLEKWMIIMIIASFAFKLIVFFLPLSLYYVSNMCDIIYPSVLILLIALDNITHLFAALIILMIICKWSFINICIHYEYILGTHGKIITLWTCEGWCMTIYHIFFVIYRSTRFGNVPTVYTGASPTDWTATRYVTLYIQSKKNVLLSCHKCGHDIYM